MFTLTSDSAIDVFRARADELGIRIIPLTYTVDGVTIEDFASGEDEYKKFYDDLKNGSMPVTSQINPFAHEEFWEKVYAEDKQDIVTAVSGSGPAYFRLILRRARPPKALWRSIPAYTYTSSTRSVRRRRRRPYTKRRSNCATAA